MSSINYAEKIPNNINLANDRTLQRALEHWQPKFIDWWKGMGPTDFQGADVYLRTAVSVVADADIGRLVSATYPLSRYTEAIEHAATAGPRGAVKVAFDLRSTSSSTKDRR